MEASLGGGDTGNLNNHGDRQFQEGHNEGHLGADQLVDNSIDTAVTEAMDSVIEQGANPEAPDSAYGTSNVDEEGFLFESDGDQDLDMSGVS